MNNERGQNRILGPLGDACEGCVVVLFARNRRKRAIITCSPLQEPVHREMDQEGNALSLVKTGGGASILYLDGQPCIASNLLEKP